MRVAIEAAAKRAWGKTLALLAAFKSEVNARFSDFLRVVAMVVGGGSCNLYNPLASWGTCLLSAASACCHCVYLFALTDTQIVPCFFKLWQDWVAYYFTWLYIGSQDAWIIFAVYLYFSKYGSLKMCKKGDEDQKPEYSDSTYFMMLFTCGVAVGMFFFGVTEPTYYYTASTRYFNNDGMTDSEKAQWYVRRACCLRAAWAFCGVSRVGHATPTTTSSRTRMGTLHRVPTRAAVSQPHGCPAYSEN